MFLHVYQQVIRSDIQGLWSGPVCPISLMASHMWLLDLQHIHTYNVCTQQSYEQCGLPGSHAELNNLNLNLLHDFYRSFAIESHMIYINCPMKLPWKAGYLILLNQMLLFTDILSS